MFEGVYNSPYNEYRQDRVPGEFYSRKAQRMGLNLNTSNIRNKYILNADMYTKIKEEKKKDTKLIIGAIGGIIGSIGLLLAGRKIIKGEKIQKLMNTIKEKIPFFKKGEKVKYTTKIKENISNFFKKFKKKDS